MRANLVIRSHIVNFQMWLGRKLRFQDAIFEPMEFLIQGIFEHDSWSFRKRKLQALQCENSGSKWMLDQEVVLSQSWKKEADFLYLEKFQIFLQMWPIMFWSQTRLSYKIFLNQWFYLDIDFLKSIVELVSLKNTKYWKSYGLAKFVKIHETTYNILHPWGIFHPF